MLPQRLVIRLIPIQIFVLSLLAGYLATTAVRALVQDGPVPVTLAQQAAQAATQAAVQAAPADVAAQPGSGGGAISPIFTPEVQFWSNEIVAWASAYQLDPNLVATVMQIESCGAPGVVSRSGAQGLFQVMPFHFEAGEDMQDPNTNASRGLSYLALGLQRAAGNVGLALAGYNGGHSQIGKNSALWPQETQRYYYWGTGIYEEATSGATQSARLQEWLQAGGASLCARAAEQQAGLAR